MIFKPDLYKDLVENVCYDGWMRNTQYDEDWDYKDREIGRFCRLILRKNEFGGYFFVFTADQIRILFDMFQQVKSFRFDSNKPEPRYEETSRWISLYDKKDADYIIDRYISMATNGLIKHWTKDTAR